MLEENCMVRRLLLILVVLFAAVYGYLRFMGVEPQDRRPGTRLSGTPAVLPADLATLAAASKGQVG